MLTAKNDNVNTLEYKRKCAHDLIDKGFILIPLQLKVPYKTLLPFNDGKPSYKLLLEIRPDKEEFDRWLKFDPDCNYGVLCGPGLYILDVDDPKKLPKVQLPPTVIVKTGRGFHYYFKSNKKLKGKKLKFGEFIGTNQYVVGPGCQHVNGNIYDYCDFTGLKDTEIAELPEWLFSENEKCSRASSQTTARTPQNLPNQNPKIEDQKPTKNRCKARNLSLLASPPLSGMDHYRNMAGDFEIAKAVLNVCEVEVEELGKPFLCPLPKHEEKYPSAALWKKENGLIMMRDFHGKLTLSKPNNFTDKEGVVMWWPLPDVYAAVKTGKGYLLRRGERAVWWLRALHEIGEVTPPPIKSYDLPPDATDSAVKLYNGFVYLVQLRQLYAPQDFSPFSWRFAATWCDIGSSRTVQKAMNYLMGQKYICIKNPRKKADKRSSRLTMLAIREPE